MRIINTTRISSENRIHVTLEFPTGICSVEDRCFCCVVSDIFFLAALSKGFSA